jgi:palmitoyl-protein thioesterase
MVGPAGYYRDPKHLDSYLKDSCFLPYINNEETSKSDTYKERFSSLDGLMLVAFTEDTMVYPHESEWFWQMDAQGNLLKLEETDFYNEDWIGLKSLDEAGKVQFISVDGDHLQFSQSDVTNTFVPFLIA